MLLHFWVPLKTIDRQEKKIIQTKIETLLKKLLLSHSTLNCLTHRRDQQGNCGCFLNFYFVVVFQISTWGIIITVIIIIEICKVPTLWLKALNKHSIAHTMYIKMENVIRKCNKKLTHKVDINKGSGTHTHNTHTHTHTHHTY